MAVTLTVVDNGTDTPLTLTVPTAPTLTVTTTTPKVVVNSTSQAVAIDVMKGLPGLQNVVVDTVAPLNPVDKMVWIDIS